MNQFRERYKQKHPANLPQKKEEERARPAVKRAKYANLSTYSES